MLNALGILLTVGTIAGSQDKPAIPAKRIVWNLGKKLSLAALLHAKGNAEALSQKMMKDARTLATALGTSIPDLPALQGGRTKDQAAALHYLLRTAARPINGHIRKTHGREHSALFEMSVKASLLTLLYSPGDTLGKKTASAVERCGKTAALPEGLWKPLVEKVNAGAPSKEVKELVFKLYGDVDAHLKGGPK